MTYLNKSLLNKNFQVGFRCSLHWNWKQTDTGPLSLDIKVLMQNLTEVCVTRRLKATSYLLVMLTHSADC